MSAALGTTATRVQRLMDEREAVRKLHEDLLSMVERREPDERDLTEIEEKQIAGYRTRAAELDEEIKGLGEVLEREERSLAASRTIRAQLAGDMEGVDRDGDEITYRTFAAYARDVILTRRFGNGEVQSSIQMNAGGPEVVEAARERLNRTPANTLSSNVPGLIPAQHIAQIFQVIDNSRPLVASATRAVLERGQLTFPKITQRPVVAVQATEKTEAGNTGMVIGMETATASTYLGGGDLSWQAIEWSTPNALDLWFRLAAADYALKTEQDAGEVVQTAAFLNDIATLFGATGSYADFMTAVSAGLGAVYANSGRMADTLYLAPDRLFYLFGLTTDVSSAFAPNGTLNVGVPGGNVASINVVVSRGLDAGVIAVGDSEALIVAETAGAPVQLRAVEPAIGGLEVGIIGAFEAVVVEDEAFALLTAAS
jgi:HK97 family phage major capsid protein